MQNALFMGFGHTINLTIFAINSDTIYISQNYGKNCKKHNRFNWEYPSVGTEND